MPDTSASIILTDEQNGSYQANITAPFVYFTPNEKEKIDSSVSIQFGLESVKVPAGSDAPGEGHIIGSFPITEDSRIEPENLKIDFKYDNETKSATVIVNFTIKGAKIPDPALIEP